MKKDRRYALKRLCLLLALTVPVKTTQAFIPQILRLIFGLGMRRAGAVAARQAVTSRGVALVTSSAAARNAVRNQMISSSNVRSALKPVNRQGASSAMTLLDAGLILSHATDLLAADSVTPIEIDSSVEALQVEIYVQNQSDRPINAVLSILIYHDETMRGTEEVFLATRQYLGTVVIEPYVTGTFVYGLNDLPAGTYHIMPHAASIADFRSDVPGLVFDPAVQTVEWI